MGPARDAMTGKVIFRHETLRKILSMQVYKEMPSVTFTNPVKQKEKELQAASFTNVPIKGVEPSFIKKVMVSANAEKYFFFSLIFY